LVMNCGSRVELAPAAVTDIDVQPIARLASASRAPYLNSGNCQVLAEDDGLQSAARHQLWGIKAPFIFEQRQECCDLLSIGFASAQLRLESRFGQYNFDAVFLCQLVVLAERALDGGVAHLWRFSGGRGDRKDHCPEQSRHAQAIICRTAANHSGS